MAIMNHAKFYFNRCMVTMIFGIRASESPPPFPGLIGLSSDPRNNCNNVRFSLVKSAENRRKVSPILVTLTSRNDSDFESSNVSLERK